MKKEMTSSSSWWFHRRAGRPRAPPGSRRAMFTDSVWHISIPAWRRVAGDKICFHIGRKFMTDCTMGSVGGGRSRQVSQSHGSHASSSSLRWQRKNSDQVCFCGLKTVIKKSVTRENLDRLFHACPRYRKGSHCNYFRWAEDDEYDRLEHLGEVKTDAQMESDAALLNHNISWRMMTLEAEVKGLRMQLYFELIVVIVVL
ncbi:hypothetical protein Ahy_B06g083987 [Arachis hypogaea]|uniref:GRF-type domain-containing protein n=1 Tax=Arachis hypogaea TaxID=3818 RepID=A0A444YR23_ARAHY|nr:hypothetical protein Ahy_B06g083987 [Arachis hypogaea]